MSPMKAGASTLTSVPASISSEMWVVDLNSKKRYLSLFNRLDNRRTGSVHGGFRLEPSAGRAGRKWDRGGMSSAVWPPAACFGSFYNPID